MGLGERRKWVPDVKMIADQLIEDYRTATWAMETGQMGVSQGDNDSLGTLASWLATAKDHGEEFQEDDWIALVRERARREDHDGAIPLMGAVIDHLYRQGRVAVGTIATGVLVETLLDRGAENDVAEAEAAIERLAVAPADERLVIREVWLLRLQALLARAHGDATAYAHLRDRYRDMARTLGFEGHIAWAEAMP